jgi:hypothetical protein
MSKEDLHKIVERLRAEVGSLEKDAGPVKDRVSGLLSDLEHQVQDLDDAGHRATMRDRIAELIGQIESEHPSITGMLEQILTALASLGV